MEDRIRRHDGLSRIEPRLGETAAKRALNELVIQIHIGCSFDLAELYPHSALEELVRELRAVQRARPLQTTPTR